MAAGAGLPKDVRGRIADGARPHDEHAAAEAGRRQTKTPKDSVERCASTAADIQRWLLVDLTMDLMPQERH